MKVYVLFKNELNEGSYMVDIFATDLDIGATGLTLMPKEKMRQEWWM